MKHILSLILVVCLQSSLLQGQKVEDLFDAYVDENSAGYIQPLADLFTANLHTGTREWSSIDTSFYIRIGMVASISYPSTKQKTFLAKTDPDFTPLVAGDTRVPTIIGSIQPVYVDGVNSTQYVYPGGYNLGSFPLATPQVTLGGIFHTEFMGRYFAFELDDDLGKISMLGLGLRHSLNPYLKMIPLDLSIGYLYQKFEDAPYLVHNSHMMSLHVGKSGRIWSAQLIGAFQSARTDIEYQYTRNSETKMNKINLSNKQAMAIELSAALRLAFINVHSSIQYAGSVTAAAGVSLQF